MDGGLIDSSARERQESRPEPALAVLSAIALICLALYCALSAASVTVGGAKFITNPADTTYPESANIYMAVTAARTGHLYATFTQPPYLTQAYGPLYYAIIAAIARASHLDFDLVRVRVRLLTYACFLLSAAIIFLICKRLRFSMVSSTLAALVFLGQPYFLTWSVSVRPDLMLVMVMLLSLLWAIEGDALNGGGYLLSGLLAGLAFLIKQPGIAAPIAVLAILLYRKKFKSAGVYASGAGVPVALVIGGLLWRGGPFLEQFAAVGKNSWSLANAGLFALSRMSELTMVIPIAIGAIGLVQAVRAANVPAQMIAAFAVANWMVGFSGLPQLGGDVNYFFPGVAACALLLPFALQMIRRDLHSKAFFVLIIVALLSVSWLQADSERRAFFIRQRQPERALDVLGPFKILSDRPAFTLHGRDPDLLDPFTNHNLELAGHWDSSPIVQNLRRHDYDLVIISDREPWQFVRTFRGISYFSPAVVKAMNEDYRVLCSTPSSAVLQPRTRDVEISPAVLDSVLGEACDMELQGTAPGLIVSPAAR
jgi:hypothetical protein